MVPPVERFWVSHVDGRPAGTLEVSSVGGVRSRRPGPVLRVGSRALAAAAALLVTVGTGTAIAVPPPPPNPSDAELEGSRAKASTQAGQVGRLTNQVAQAESRLVRLQADVELKMEEANKALVDLDAARDAAARATADAEAAKADADRASEAINQARRDIDEFAAGSYKQGSTIGSITAYLGAKSPDDLLARADLLNAVSGSELDALDNLTVARTEKANKDSAARAALAVARQKQRLAEAAKVAADRATAAARAARRDGLAQAEQVKAQKESAESRLAAAQSTVSGLEQQRRRYQQWLAAKQAEEAAAAHHGGGGPAVSAPAGSARTVINRALSQLGVPYAWGGGTASGPSHGIRDGGVADMYGDYNKIGFDCSGLMIYAFAGAGVSLPHYSGYQAQAGRQVPLSAKAPGDMLFWATGGLIHHVALYIGNEQVIEAPYSGSQVRIAPVRYGGIVPYATRVL